MPQGCGIRQFLIDSLLAQIDTLIEYQHADGLWHTLITDPTSYLETSASAGFAYGIMRAINKRYISESYRQAAHNAIKAIIKEISPTGAVQNVSVGTGMGDSLDFYKNINKTEMPYGQSMTILALTEFLQEYI